MASRFVAVAGWVALVLSAGCGVPAQDEPHAVELPRGPLVRPTGDETPGPAGGEVGEVVCLVLDGRLVQSVRRVATAPSAQQQLDELVAGPTPSERNRGLVTTLAGLALTVRDQSGTGVTVEVAEPDDGNARSDEVLAYGQVVCTLTARAEVNSVVFTRDGQQLQVPRADGALVTEPLQLRDFADLIGPA